MTKTQFEIEDIFIFSARLENRDEIIFLFLCTGALACAEYNIGKLMHQFVTLF